jgi:transposase InsO family protein
VRCRFIQAEKANHSVRSLCRVMQVPRSTYYDVTTRQPSERDREDQRLKPLIRRIHLDSKRRYGSPRVHRALRNHGVWVGRKRVTRLMSELGLRSISRRKDRCATDSSPAVSVQERPQW